jgi:hypothetical protein
MASMARGQGMRVLGGGRVPLGEEGLPFAPVIEALRGLADLDADELQAVAGTACAELMTTQRGHRQLPGYPSRAAAGPTATPHDLIPVGHNGHRRPDTGTWTLGRPHRTPITWTGPAGHRTPTPDTGRRTGTRTR